MALLTCVDCGGRVSSRAPACPHCGCPLEDSARAISPAVPPPSLPPPPPETPPEKRRALPLDVLTQAGMSSLTLDRPVTVGRVRADILVEHQDIAPLHCRLEPGDGEWRVEALGEGGVFAGGTRVASVRLRPGEIVDLGGFPGAVALALPCALGEPLALRLRVPGAPEAALVLQKLPMVIGRSAWVDLPLADRNVSHAHARLRLEGGRVVIDDLQSRNGTFVDGQRVRAGQALRRGDVIRLGESELTFGEAPAGPAVADGGRTTDEDRTPRDRPDVVIPAGLTLEQLAGAPDQHVHVPIARSIPTQILSAPRHECPACGEALDLVAGGLLTGAYRLVKTAVSVVERHRAVSRVGRCSSCGARLAVCPLCESANTAPSLFETLACRSCAEPFSAG